MRQILKIAGIFMLTLAIAFSGCTAEQEEVTKGPITVGSKLDLEGQLLGQIIILMLEDDGFQVNDETSFGATSVVRKALESGEIDVYPEYTGNGAFFFDETDSDVWNDAQAGYERVKQLDLEAFNIVWLQPAPANNTWAGRPDW